MREPQRRFQAFFVGKANYFFTKTIFFVDSLAPYVHFHKENGFPFTRKPCSILCTKYIHAPSAYKAGFTTDASAARMCGGVAAATGTSGTGEGPVGKVPLPKGGEGGTAGIWPSQGTPPGDPRG